MVRLDGNDLPEDLAEMSAAKSVSVTPPALACPAVLLLLLVEACLDFFQIPLRRT